MRDLGQIMTTYDLWHCILTFRGSSEVTDLADTVLTCSSQMGGFRGFLSSCARICGSFFSYRPVYRASLPFPMSVRAFGVIFPGRVMFPSRMLYITNIRSTIPKQHGILHKIERGTRWWKFRFDKANIFLYMDLLSWRVADFVKIWPLTSCDWVKY